MTVLKNVGNLIKDYMDLNTNQIWLKTEKVSLPQDSSFWVTVGFMGNLNPFNITKKNVFNETSELMEEEMSVTTAAQVTIDIKGRTNDVLNRKEEILMALSTTKAIEDQLKNGYSIGKLPTSMNDISGIDGNAIPYRFQVTFRVQFIKKKTKPSIDYYDNFSEEIIYE